MMWYLQDVARFHAEGEAVRTLEREVEWLTISAMRLDTTCRFCVDADIKVRERVYPVTLRYGQSFPFSAPSVLPQQPQRWSNHQYGNDELCLEYGPDTWRPELTGADLLRSAERLLSAETPSADRPHAEAPSRHATTMGQEMRDAYFRLLVTRSLFEALQRIPRGQVGSARFAALVRENTWVVAPVGLDGLLDESWTNADVPASLARLADFWTGQVYTLPVGVLMPTFTRASEFIAFLREHGLKTEEPASAGIDCRLVLDDHGVHLLFFSRTEDRVYEAKALTAGAGQRLASAYTTLAVKKVGLVGCGSVGSKIALMLARAGVQKFVLIDDDIFLPENLVRHDLDWASMAEHKTDALARRLNLAAPGTDCTVRRHRLGGQEANGGFDAALSLLKDCDLLVDATADSHVFNLIASVAQVGNRPVIWAEVFAGGLGGMIARSRPAFDPSPQVVRTHVIAWCTERGVASPRPEADYTASADGGRLVADDADVTVIAGHAARFAIDTLLERTPSWFPVSAYLIGLSPGWIFGQPFETFPIDVGPPLASPRAVDAPDPTVLSSILAMFESRRDYPADSL